MVDERGQVLLVQRDDSRTWAPPGGAMDAGEMPPEAAAREVEEETGLKVLPVRLVGVHYLRLWQREYLSFGFRCLRRGGELKPSRETPAVGFFNLAQPPGRMASTHYQRLARGLTHEDTRPYWGTQRPSLSMTLTRGLLLPFVYRFLDWQRRRRGEPVYQKPPGWLVETRLIVRNEAGEVLWLRDAGNQWRLPAGKRRAREAPWDAAARAAAAAGMEVQLLDFAGSAFAPNNQITLAFTAAETARPDANAAVAYFAADKMPTHALPADIAHVQNALLPQPIYFRRDEL
ncbi:MAG: hypothetical protein Fur0021_22690 [Candidatus Promineifilaceae bacterium]